MSHSNLSLAEKCKLKYMSKKIPSDRIFLSNMDVYRKNKEQTIILPKGMVSRKDIEYFEDF